MMSSDIFIICLSKTINNDENEDKNLKQWIQKQDSTRGLIQVDSILKYFNMVIYV